MEKSFADTDRKYGFTGDMSITHLWQQWTGLRFERGHPSDAERFVYDFIQAKRDLEMELGHSVPAWVEHHQFMSAVSASRAGGVLLQRPPAQSTGGLGFQNLKKGEKNIYTAFLKACW
ncbi:hypothetical protein N7539_000475 [Penicillium diatomitis]|uniref:Uncharacterized protein n=1 Tax=Penicillium diatomitis TaxID=2819901 RepID=A0A9W9XLV7_9EURO|nr:uncharacterized protein N7539_000475 [Penicillium diatomitis]KAJ5495359.1 hypothetical protein N7539_000475 [Penicillium diatomitis]